MKPLILAALAIAACCTALSAAAGPGDVYVPAHRTSDGHWVPANVPTSSGGTRMAKKLPARSTKVPAATPTAASPMLPPLFVDADPIRRD